MTATSTGTGLGRRWRRFVLALQGRLDGQAADRVLPWLLASGLFAWYTALGAAALRSFEGGSGAGPWLQASWRRAHGGQGRPLGGQDPATASWSLVSEPVLWATRVLPPEAVFTVVQAGALALAVVPLWRIARTEAHLRVGATWVVVTAYALAPTLHRANLSVFHPEAIALPALLWAYLSARREHWVRYGLLVGLVLACRADLGLTVAALGALLALMGQRRAGLISLTVGASWTVAAVIVLDPVLPSRALTPSGEFVTRSSAPLAVVPEFLVDPLRLLADLVAEPSIGFLVVVLAPLLFLPLVSPRNVAVAVPALVLAMIVDTSVQRVAQRGVIDLAPAAAHVAPAMAFVFIALVFALERIGQRSVTRVNVDHRVLLALVFGATLFFLAAAPSSPYREPWTWGSRDAADGARLAAAEIAGDDVPIAVSPPSTAVVAERALVVELPLDPADLTTLRIVRVASEVDAVLLDTSPAGPATDGALWSPEEVERVTATFGREGFQESYRAEGVILLTDGAQPADASG